MKTETATLNKRNWNTYATYGYTYDVANDAASQGGVHHHMVRKTAKGWQKRICQSNGRHVAYGPVSAITDVEGEEAFAKACYGN